MKVAVIFPVGWIAVTFSFDFIPNHPVFPSVSSFSAWLASGARTEKLLVAGNQYMETNINWIEHFKINLEVQRINWALGPTISDQEVSTIVSSLQAWQLGETSDGSHLLKAAGKYANRLKDIHYLDAVRLFIQEEQKHGNNLGKYLDLIGQPKIQRNWGDSLFRSIRYFNTSMELWTLSVIVVESTAQVFYQSLKDATQCQLLKQICTDILIDEAYHIDFQMERLATIYESKPALQKFMVAKLYSIFFYMTVTTVWMGHRRLFKAGGNSYGKYMAKMKLKYSKTIERITGNDSSFAKAGLTNVMG